MKKIIAAFGILLLMAVSCHRPSTAGREPIEAVKAMAADTTGLFSQIVTAGTVGPRGTIALIGEPADGISLARRFLTLDQHDNIDGRPLRDSLPDFAGEEFLVFLDEYNAPYAHFLSGEHEGEDSLRFLAVQHAVDAWKKDAKMLIFTSPLQGEYGLFDVDTLRAMAGGKTVILSGVETLLADALDAGARNIAVWTSRENRHSGVYEAVFARMAPEGATLEVLTPDTALDVRTELRSLLRQYQMRRERLDALLVDSYSADLVPLQSELKLIRLQGTAEDDRFSRMLSPDFRMVDAAASVTQAAYRALREKQLFTHRIAKPGVRYFLTVESEEGGMSLVEAGARYIQETYVSDIH